jgi:hypothetical protein
MFTIIFVPAATIKEVTTTFLIVSSIFMLAVDWFSIDCRSILSTVEA